MEKNSSAILVHSVQNAAYRPGTKCSLQTGYKMQPADRVQNAACRLGTKCSLQTGYKIQPADWVQNAACRLGTKCSLQTGYKMQTTDWVQNADCRLSTKCRVQTEYKMQSADWVQNADWQDWVQNADYRPGSKCRLQTGYKIQTADWVHNLDCRPGTKCRLQTGYKMQTENKDCFSSVTRQLCHLCTCNSKRGSMNLIVAHYRRISYLQCTVAINWIQVLQLLPHGMLVCQGHSLGLLCVNLLDLGSPLIHKIYNHLQNKCSGAPFLISPGNFSGP